MKKLISIAAILFAAPAFAGDLGVGAIAVTQSSASLNAHVGGDYGYKGQSMYQIGNQSTADVSFNGQKLENLTSSVSFEMLEVKGGVKLPNSNGSSHGNGVIVSGGFVNFDNFTQ